MGGVHLEEERDQLNVRCLADANPPASILWKRATGGPGGEMEVAGVGEALIASPVRRTHAGQYFCEAANTVGESKPLSLRISVNCEHTIVRDNFRARLRLHHPSFFIQIHRGSHPSVPND